MSLNTSNLPPNDPKVIAEIVDKLKKQGLFDKFRKDCLADVDTKPAYQNLCRRVDTFCANFLTNIQWTPDLNKNKLRDTLRNEITQGKMLSGGVNHIVSQVVNPKIQKIFKPDIDAVVCEFFGIDPEERDEKLRQQAYQKEERYRQLALNSPNKQHLSSSGVNQQGFPGSTNFGMHGMMGVGGYMANQMSQQAAMQGSINLSEMTGISTSMAHSIQNTLNQMGATQVSPPMFPNMPPTIPNFSMPPPGFGPATPTYNPCVPPPNMTQTTSSSFPGMQQQTFTSGSTTFQQVAGGLVGMMYNNQMGISEVASTEVVSSYGIQGPAMSTLEALRAEKKEEKGKDKDKEKKKELPTLTVEDLLNVALPTKAIRERGKKERDRHRDDSQSIGRSDSGSPININTNRDNSTKSDRRVEERRSERLEEKHDRLDDRRSDRSDERRSDYSGSYNSEVSRSDRVRVDEYHNQRSPGRGSGVRNDFYRSEGKQPPEPPCPKPPSPPPEPKEKVYHFAWDDVETGAVSEMSISSVHTSDLSSFDEGSSDASGLEDISSDELRSEDEAGTKPPEPPEPPKDVPDSNVTPQKLIALKYNYSDSEDEETREERKTRIAEEKEERYLKRQLRRAELEARKEEKKEKKAAEKKKAEDQGAVLPPEPSDELRPMASRERRLRAARTKEALKEQLRAEKREQKVQQRVMDRRMALRRQRKRNSKYMSDEFTSIFTDKRKILSNEGYVETGDDPDYSPTGDTYETRSTRRPLPKAEPVSPCTPTQDEVEYTQHSAESGRSGKRLTPGEDHDVVVGRSTTPFSDTSEKTESEVGRGRRRRRTLSGRQSPDLEDKKPVRPQEPLPLHEQRAHSQRYDDSDLYKPHTSYRTRRRGTSPVKEAPTTVRRGGAWGAGSQPAPIARGNRPPSPPMSNDEYRAGTNWQRHGSQENFKTGRNLHFSGSLERQTKATVSPECRQVLYTPNESPDRNQAKFHQWAPTTPTNTTKPSPSDVPSSDEKASAEKRPRVPLSHINFGEAAKQARTYVRNVTKPPPPPPSERPPDEFIDFGEAEWQVRQLKASTSVRPIRRPVAPGSTNQRPYRRGGMSPRGDSFRGSFKQDLFQRGDHHNPVGGSNFGNSAANNTHRGVPASTAKVEHVDPRASDHGDNRTSDCESRSDRMEYRGQRWRRQVSNDEEVEWQNLPKVKSLEEEKEEWESISDDEDLGDNFDESRDIDKYDKHTTSAADWRPNKQYGKASSLQPKPGISHEQSRDWSYNSCDENQTECAAPSDDGSIYQSQPSLARDGSDLSHYRVNESELEEGEEVDDSDYIAIDSHNHALPPQPPEPPEYEDESRKRQRAKSMSSGEVEEDGEVNMPELPQTGMSPTARHEHPTEMPQAGMSPSEGLSRRGPLSPRRIVPMSQCRSPSPHRSMARSPSRIVPKSPTRSIPKSPTRSIPRSPTRSIPRSPTRSIPRSPTRSIPRSPTRSIPKSPTRSIPRSPTRSIPRSPNRSIPTRSVPRSPTRLMPRSPLESHPSYGGPSTPPENRPRSPRTQNVSSPESGEVGDFDSSSEKSLAVVRSPVTSEADNSSSPPQRLDHSFGGGGAEFDAQQDTPGSRHRPAIPTTRSRRKRSEEAQLPIAKRLRR